MPHAERLLYQLLGLPLLGTAPAGKILRPDEILCGNASVPGDSHCLRGDDSRSRNAPEEEHQGRAFFHQAVVHLSRAGDAGENEGKKAGCAKHILSAWQKAGSLYRLNHPFFRP